MTYIKQNKGFTLVELAIVIVIIGFLVAGIAAGANMIKQAELRSMITDLQQYQVAYNNFIGRYNKIPGDMDSAFSFWGTNCGAAAVNCNGNGNGVITHATNVTASPGNEVLKAWKHLSLASMISAGIQTINTANAGELTIGTEAPSSKKTGAGFFISTGGTNNGGTGAVTQFSTATNAVFIGKPLTAAALMTPALTPEEAFSIDQKLDDGLVNAGVFAGANTGVVRANDGQGIAAATTGTSCTNTATGANYDVTTTNAACVLGLALN